MSDFHCITCKILNEVGFGKQMMLELFSELHQFSRSLFQLFLTIWSQGHQGQKKNWIKRINQMLYIHLYFITVYIPLQMDFNSFTTFKHWYCSEITIFPCIHNANQIVHKTKMIIFNSRSLSWMIWKFLTDAWVTLPWKLSTYDCVSSFHTGVLLWSSITLSVLLFCHRASRDSWSCKITERCGGISYPLEQHLYTKYRSRDIGCLILMFYISHTLPSILLLM